jgi:prepilin-type N-terminal cleavage/methylation domain-containing protein
MRHSVNTQRGLTLVELMLVLAVSGLLLGGMWRLYHSSLLAYRSGWQEVRLALGARTVLRHMTHDVQNALASAVPYGIQGSNVPTTAADTDRLTLTTIAYPTPTQQTIRYYLEPASREGTLVLKRALMTTENRSIQRVMSLSEHLSRLNVHYFDGKMWYDTWQRADLPRALEITIMFQNSGRKTSEHRFTTTIIME